RRPGLGGWQMSDDYRGLGWRYGTLGVQRLGGMLAPVTFVLPNGRQVSPMHVAPWADEPAAAGLPGILRRLRGEWPCLPYGYAADNAAAPAEWKAVMGVPVPDEEIHGFSSNHDWRWEEGDDASLRLSIVYPVASPVSHLVRTVTPDPKAPAVDTTMTAYIRTACRLPMGIHATFRLPEAPGSARIEPAPFRVGRSFPGAVEPGKDVFAVDAKFDDLAKVPGAAGGTVDASRVPLPTDTEALLLLLDIGGEVALANTAEGYRVRLSWQQEHFPSLQFWYSNRGRAEPPWNGRHLALGMEPICGAFDMGTNASAGDNPISRSGTATARDFAAGEIFTTRYRISAEAL